MMLQELTRPKDKAMTQVGTKTVTTGNPDMSL